MPISDYNRKIVKTGGNFNLKGKVKVRVLVVFASLVTTLFAAQLVFANNLATDGQKLSQIQGEIKKIEAENMTLKVTIAKESSLAGLSKKAQDMGYQKPSKLISL
jgi:cell division protein FtsB